MTAQNEDELTLLKEKTEKKIKELEGRVDTHDSAVADLQAQAMHNSYDSDRQLTEEEIKELHLKENVDKENLKEIKKEEELDAEQKRQLNNARKSVAGSQAVNLNPSIFSDTTTTDNSNESAERQQEIADEKQEIQEDVAAQIEEAKQNRDERIAKAKEGPHGILGFFAAPIIMIILGVIDSAVGIIPGIGDIIMAIILAVVWFIPALLLFDLFLYVRIIFFLVLDAVVGTVGDIAGPLSALIDFAPELITLMTKTSPAHLVRKAYFEKLPAIVSKIRQQYQIEVEQIRNKGKNKMRFAMKKLQGHFAGVAGEGRKVLFMLLFVLTGVLTQVFGWFGFESTGQIIFSVGFLLLLFVLKAMNMLGTQEFAGTAAFFGFNLGFRYILQADSFLTRYIGSGNALVVTVIFIVASLLLVLKVAKPEAMTSQRMVGVLAFLVLALSVPYMIGYIGSDQFMQDYDQKRVETQAEVDNFNFWERAIRWYGEMQARGRGEYIPTVNQESVHEYVGLEIAGVEATRAEYFEGEAIRLNIEFASGSKEGINFAYSCSATNSQAETSTDGAGTVDALSSFPAGCLFPSGLPKGTHLVDVNALYDYSSQVEIPVMFMTQIKRETIIADGGDPEAYEEGVDPPETSSGPVDFKVKTSINSNLFEQPLVYNPDDLTEYPKVIIIQLENSLGPAGIQGEMKSITKMEYDLPEGLRIGDCAFQSFDTSPLEPTRQENGRWIFDITSYYTELDLDDQISCQLFMDEQYKSFFLPTSGYSIDSLRFNVEYYYGLNEQKPVTVV